MSAWGRFRFGSEIDRLLLFARRSITADGFGWLSEDGVVDHARPVQTWIHCRMTHVFALAVLAGDEGARTFAEHGVQQLLQGPLHDSRHDGWYSSTDTTEKLAYDHAFVLLASATAAQAAVSGAYALLTQALSVWQHRFWDPVTRTNVEEWSRDWTRLDSYRGANSAMHTVEALLAVADAIGGSMGPVLQTQALDLTERVVDAEARQRGWRLPEHFDASWTADLEYNRDNPSDPFRPFGVTVGHQFEWARLCGHLTFALDEAPPWLGHAAAGLYAAAKTRGWNCDGHSGFVYTLDWQDEPVVRARMHWVHAEAMAAAAVLQRLTGSDEYAEDYEHWKAFADRYFSDPSTGSWHHELTPSGSVGSDTWAGEPDVYHVVQALLLPDLPPSGSVAAGLQQLIRGVS